LTNMKIRLIFWITAMLLGIAVFIPTVGAQEHTNVVDFNKQIVSVYGLAGMPWEIETSYEEEKSRAWMDALHHAYESILSVPLMEGVDVRNALDLNPSLKERLGMILFAAKKTFFEPDVSGLVRCRLEVPFFGKMSLRSAFYLAALRPQPMEPKSFLASWAYIASDTYENSSEASGTEVSRIVVDMRHTNFEPSIFPRFFNEEGRLLFQEAQVPGPERFSRPMVKFSDNVEDAYARVDSKKVLFAAGFIPQLSKRDVKISHPEAEMFLHFCRLMTMQPLGEREILIIYGSRNPYGGLLPKAQAKEKETDKTRKSTTQLRGKQSKTK